MDDKDISIDGENRAAERQSREQMEMLKIGEAEKQRQHDLQMQDLDMQKLRMQNDAKERAAEQAAAKAKAAAKKKPNPGLAG